MKRSSLAEVFYRYNTDPLKLEETGKYLVDNITHSINLLFSIDPEACKSVILQMNEQLTPEVLDERISAYLKAKRLFKEDQIAKLGLGPHLIFTPEDEVEGSEYPEKGTPTSRGNTEDNSESNITP
jgi:hypothetical protein